MNYNTFGSGDCNIAAHIAWHANEADAALFLFAKRARNILAAGVLAIHT